MSGLTFLWASKAMKVRPIAFYLPHFQPLNPHVVRKGQSLLERSILLVDAHYSDAGGHPLLCIRERIILAAEKRRDARPLYACQNWSRYGRTSITVTASLPFWSGLEVPEMRSAIRLNGRCSVFHRRDERQR